MGKGIGGRWGGNIKMPSEVANGGDAGAGGGPVLTYRLSDEELAKYREGGHGVSKLHDRIEELHARFAAGDGETNKGKQALAREFGVSLGTIYNRYDRWNAIPMAAELEPAADEVHPKAESTPVAPPQPVTEEAAPAEPAPPAAATGDQEFEQLVSEAHDVAAWLDRRMGACPPTIDRVATYHAAPVSLCDNCIKRDVCPLAPSTEDQKPWEMAADEKPTRLRHVRVILSPRVIQECSAYHREAIG